MIDGPEPGEPDLAPEYERCVCGKATFRSTTHARAHARRVHSSRMRIYRCEEDSVHLTNNEKNTKLPSMIEAKKDPRMEARRARYESRRVCASYVHER